MSTKMNASNGSTTRESDINFRDRSQEKALSQRNHCQITITSSNNNIDNNLSLSEDEDESETSHQLSGSLNKWTNYIHGWQKRYFILRGSTLAYYKSEQEIAFGCRGAISIGKAPHEFDECRFDVSLNDNVWYLRAENFDIRQKWIDNLETCKAESGYGSQSDLRRHGSLISLTSNKSLTSSSSFKKSKSLKEKLAELETFRDIVCKQIETLQSYFDSCAQNPCSTSSSSSWNDELQMNGCSNNDLSPIIIKKLLDKTLEADDMDSDMDVPDCSADVVKKNNHEIQRQRLMDFKGEALTFKATTAGILSTLQHCIDLMQQRDEAWRRKLEKPDPSNARNQKQSRPTDGPDFEEGPHSALNEEEWHDAVDAALERQDIEDRRVTRLLRRELESPFVKPFDKILLQKSHHLYKEIDKILKEQVSYAKSGVEDGMWQLFAEEGEMKMYKREMEIDGLVCDPLKAVHSVKGVTAREYLHYFYEPEYKMDWDTTLEAMTVVEKPSEDTCVIQQVHKRIWPASQRESVFWSHFRRLGGEERESPNGVECRIIDSYIVCNHDTQHSDLPPTKNIRVGLTVAMLCQTVTEKLNSSISELKRDDLMTKIIYVAQVNPGGWAPSSVLRAVYKREYPKFLKRFTQYVIQKVDGTKIRF
uniref:Collagen type IV alpha-3-binding protein n=1 Tax=Romanomermis culicivorax TaxID=13658 RepID=A0A915IAP1_ROMCU